MAVAKKTTATTKTRTTPAKKEVKPADKASEVKTEVKAAAEEVKESVKKTTARKTAVKPAAEKAETVKKETVKKETAKKGAVRETVHVEFGGKAYTTEDLLKIFRDVWKYDLNGKEENLKDVELYVKPEENVTYYVANGEIQGSFNI